MFTFLKSIFKNKPLLDPNARVVATRPTAEAAAPLPRVETAQLQLAAIIAKFPEELKSLVTRQPSDEVMIALPLPTIRKYLPTGSVKMSLASVVRQAPAGTFSILQAHDKRMVDVPLAEILKRVGNTLLKLRDDQRFTSLAEGDVDIFGDEENPRALTPRLAEVKFAVGPPAPEQPQFVAPATIKFPAGELLAPPPEFTLSERARKVAEPVFALVPASKGNGSVPQAAVEASPAVAPPIPPTAQPTALVAEAAVADKPRAQSALLLPLEELIGSWPEPFRSEASFLGGAIVALPGSRVSEGLARGKVAFSWGEIRGWMTPPLSRATEGSDAAELVLPLRVVAPAFLSQTAIGRPLPRGPRLDDSIPDLFSDGTAPVPVEIAPRADECGFMDAPTPAEPIADSGMAPDGFHFADETAPAVVEAIVEDGSALPFDNAPPVWLEAETPPHQPSESFELLESVSLVDGRPSTDLADPLEPAESREAVLTPKEEGATMVPNDQPSTPPTAGEFLGAPQQNAWSPKGLVAALLQRPEIEGAIIALQEGLVIAHELPPGMKGEIFAAFLPQIFARLNQYGTEMQLGSVEDVTINAAGRQCRFFRLNKVFLGVLSREGAMLPSELRVCADALTED